jgi:UDP-N-acetylmuramoyl-tripeptide--D-alanyl-D-alanine ligase
MAERPLHTTTTFSLSTILAETEGRWLVENPKREGIYQDLSLSTDTRSIGPGTCFIPLVGERFDGHDYLVQAFEQGASVVLANDALVKDHPEWKALPAVLVVQDTLEAYLKLGRAHRRRLTPKVVAITGSSGKTTTKELMYAAFSGCRITQKTEKNFNNEVGLTQTLLSIQPGCEILVAEMAMRGLNQIEVLSHYGEPDVAIVVNVGPAHIGLLGSLENIAKAKCEIFSGLHPEKGVGVCNGDDDLLTQTAKNTWQGTLIDYHLSEVSHIEELPEGGIAFDYHDVHFSIPLPGRHIISNTLAVIKTAEVLGLELQEVAKGLAAYQPISGRWQQSPIPGTQTGGVINDAYNANPSSMRAALEAFLNTKVPQSKKVLVLGAMNELGEFSHKYHQDLGQWLSAKPGVSACWFVGEEAKPAYQALMTAKPGCQCAFYQTVFDLIEGLPTLCKTFEDTLFLLKGSRGFALETLIEALDENKLNKTSFNLTPQPTN